MVKCAFDGRKNKVFLPVDYFLGSNFMARRGGFKSVVCTAIIDYVVYQTQEVHTHAHSSILPVSLAFLSNWL
jgi:hypothetical protein